MKLWTVNPHDILFQNVCVNWLNKWIKWSEINKGNVNNSFNLYLPIQSKYLESYILKNEVKTLEAMLYLCTYEDQGLKIHYYEYHTYIFFNVIYIYIYSIGRYCRNA